MITTSYVGTLFTRLYGTWAVLHGLLTVIDNGVRWSTPQYYIVSLLPGSSITWGVVLVLAGVMVLTASMKGRDWSLPGVGNEDYKSYMLIKNIGLWVIAAWTFFFAVGILIAVIYFFPVVPLGELDKDVLICITCLILSKSVEPRTVKNVKKI